ncbi:hypothetical protein BVI1335_930005 [Burkholderia vietnamiensis]|nr:hypothetical protein BVI1335_930005 [Burkholderia vietnamiensis]
MHGTPLALAGSGESMAIRPQYRILTRPATGFMGNGVLHIGSRRDRMCRTPFFVWRMT